MNHSQAPPANRTYFAGAAGQRCRTLRGAASVAFRPQYYPLPQKNFSAPEQEKPNFIEPRRVKEGKLAGDRILAEKRPHFPPQGGKSFSRCPDMLGPPNFRGPEFSLSFREAVKKFKRWREKPPPLSGGGANSCRQNRREMKGCKAFPWLPPGDASNLEIT
jgi:hypothetical protein